MAKTSLVPLLTLFCGSACAEDGDGHGAKRFWKASIAAVAAGSIVDMQSSMGKHETNGLLANRQGVFSMQRIGLRLAIAGARGRDTSNTCCTATRRLPDIRPGR
jgi:hypothetical protein